MRIATTFLLASFAAAQGANLPLPLPADLEALSKRVDAAHHPAGPTAPVTAFEADLELHVVAPGEEQGGRVGLFVRYLQSPRPGTDKVRHLIRYKVLEAGRPIERGRDEFGFWHLVQGKPRDLTEAEAADRAACERDTNLARQLVRFLEPGVVLRSLLAPGPVREEALQLGRERSGTPCETVEGGLVAFPLLQRGGDDAPVQVKIWVTKAEGRLLAIHAWPLVDGKREEKGLELVRLQDLHERDGLLVPRRVEHLFRDAEGRLRTHSQASITKMSLRPNLTPADFDRSK